jgi:hypothetical protein
MGEFPICPSRAPQRHPPAIPPRDCARARPARGGYTLQAPRSQGWSGAALLVLGLDTRRRSAEDLGNGLGRGTSGCGALSCPRQRATLCW